MGGRDIRIHSFGLMSSESNNDFEALEGFVREIVEICFVSDPAIGSAVHNLLELDTALGESIRHGRCGDLSVALQMLRYACAEVVEGSSAHSRLTAAAKLLINRLHFLQ
jgi:hypothetical protein